MCARASWACGAGLTASRSLPAAARWLALVGPDDLAVVAARTACHAAALAMVSGRLGRWQRASSPIVGVLGAVAIAYGLVLVVDGAAKLVQFG